MPPNGLTARLDRLERLVGAGEPDAAEQQAAAQLIEQIEALIERSSPDQVADAFERLLREFPHLRRAG
jgi:hypothetical protein